LAASGLVEKKAVWKVWEQFITARDDSAWSRAWLLASLGAWRRQSESWVSTPPGNPGKAQNGHEGLAHGS
jgi:hypothetical protein